MSVRDLEFGLARLEAKVDLIMASLVSIQRATPPVDRPVSAGNTEPAAIKAKVGAGEAQRFFRKFSIKQNAVLQMLIHAASNDTIAERMGVTSNTAKVHVRIIAKKCKVSTRAQIMAIAGEHYRAIDDDTYRAVTGGIPKDWHQNFRDPDPFADIYRTQHDEDAE